MELISELVKIFQNNCSYDKINELCEKQLRSRKNGINIKDNILYKFLYTDIRKTKQEIVSYINNLNETSFRRQSFEEKENNISIKFYENLLNEIILFFNQKIATKDNQVLVAVDGTYNNDNKRNIMLNLGLYDITNGIPLNINYGGTRNRNKEVKMFKQYISTNLAKFKNVIFVADRLYFNYSLLDFLNSKNLKYVIRAKHNGQNLDPTTTIYKSNPNYSVINKLKLETRIIKSKIECDKTICAGKKESNKIKIRIKDDIILVTNLMDNTKYPDETILKYYSSRWDIEIFFKLLKSNFKFQN